MEESNSDIPQLTVKAETACTPSTTNDTKNTPPPLEAKSENKVVSDSDGLSHLKKESSIKRVDSDSKFGFMETIPLEQSMQETPPYSPALNVTVENSQSVSVQMKSFTLSENIPNVFGDAKNQPKPSSESERNVLSKYFQTDASQQQKGDTVGGNFFDALSGSSSAPAKQGVFSQNKDPFQDIFEAEKKEDAGSQEQGVQEKPPPALLKFFSDDKSGGDQDGKAFFDKISDVKNSLDPNILQIKEPIAHAKEFLSSPEINGEIEEAWIPSDKTRQALVTILTSKVPLTPDRSLLTAPGILVEQHMVDGVKALLMECNSPFALNRKTITENDVSEDETGLQKLMEAGCYNAALNLTKRILKAMGQGVIEENKAVKHSPLSLRIWYVRIALFVKLQRYNFAEMESAAFGDLDKPDLYYEYYPDMYKGKQGSMVPFSFRLLLAELPQYLQKYQLAMDNMFKVLHVIQRMIKNIEKGCAEDGTMRELSESRRSASLEIWGARERRVLYSILNCVLSQKDYTLAVQITRNLIEKSKEKVPQLHSALGRIYLQLGDVKYAQECFSKASNLAENIDQFYAEDMINKALLAIALNNNEEAFNCFKEAYTLQPQNAMLANNMAVCLLYMGKLKECLNLLKKTIQNNPSSCLHDGLLFNICTLYELESSRCAQKKVAMLELVSQYVGDSFNVSCLKIQTIPGKT